MPDWVAPVSLGGAIGIVLLLVRLGEWKGKVDADRKSIAGIEGWKGRVDADRTNFKEFMAEIREDIKTLLRRLPPRTTEGASPLRLTELGERVSKEIGAREWVDRIVGQLGSRMENREAYEIQDLCFKYVSEELEYSDAEARAVKKSAYEHGIQDEQVWRVLAIELRDKLLEVAGLEAP